MRVQYIRFCNHTQIWTNVWDLLNNFTLSSLSLFSEQYSDDFTFDNIHAANSVRKLLYDCLNYPFSHRVLE